MSTLSEEMAASYLLVDIGFTSWGGSKIRRDVTQEVTSAKHATDDAGTFRVNLLASADRELKQVRAAAAALRAVLYARTLPWTLTDEGVRRGARLIATAQAIPFLTEIAEMRKSYDAAVQELQSVWDVRVQQALTNLGGMADASVYPAASEIPELFGATIEVRPMPVVADFSRASIPSALAEALGERFAEQTRVQVNNAMLDLRDRLTTEIQRIATQLGKAGAGEQTRLYETLLGNTRDLCALARSMNLTGSQRFTDLIDGIERDLLRYPIEVLREDTAKAAEIAGHATATLGEIEGVEWF